jgi:hypothetical protein
MYFFSFFIIRSFLTEPASTPPAQTTHGAAECDRLHTQHPSHATHRTGNAPARDEHATSQADDHTPLSPEHNEPLAD